MTQLSTASAFLAQVAGCAFLAVLLSVAATRFKRSWLVAWATVFALAAVGVWSASLYFAGHGRMLVAVYSVLVVAASVLLVWGLLRFVDSPRWSRRLALAGVPLLVVVFITANVMPNLPWFTTLSVVQALFMAFTGIILVASVSPSWGRILAITGCLVQIGSHLFYLSSQVAGLGYSDLYRYGLTADLVAELLIGFGLLLLALNRERWSEVPSEVDSAPVSGSFSAVTVPASPPPRSLEDWFAAWDEGDPAAILAVGIEPGPSGGQLPDQILRTVGAALEDLAEPDGIVVYGDRHTLTSVVTGACFRDPRALERLIRVARLVGEPQGPRGTSDLFIRWGVSICRRRDLAQEAIQVARRRMREKLPGFLDD